MKNLMFIKKKVQELLDIKFSIFLFMILLSIFLFIANFTHGYIGSFSRYVADDYCTAGKLNTLGFWETQSFWFNNWTGRFSFTFFVSVFELFGPIITSFIPYLLIILLYLSLFVFLRSLLKKILISKSNVFSFFITSIFIFVILFTIPNIGQNLYWMTGSTTYFFPFILFFFVSWLMIETKSNEPKGKITKNLSYILIVISTFILGGFSEVLSVLQILIFGLGYVYVNYSNKQITINKPLLFGLLGSVIGLFVMVAAPGNQTRLSNHLPHPDLSTLLINSFLLSSKFTILWFIKQIQIIWPVCSILIIFSAFQDYGETFKLYYGNKKNIFLIFLFISSLFLVYVSFVPSLWATANPPVSRVMIFPTMILTVMLFTFSIFIGIYFQDLFLIKTYNKNQFMLILISIIVLYFLTAIPIYQAKINFSRRAEARTFANRWEIRENKIKDQIESGNSDLLVDIIPINISDVEHIQSDPNNWINICAAEFYGVQKIKAE